MDKQTLDRERKKNAKKIVSGYQDALKQLKKYKGVMGLEIGLKRKDGKLTDEIVYRVCVKEKKSKSKLSKKDILPTEINGINIDVIEEPEDTLLLGTSDLPDTGKYRSPLQGGVQVGNGTGGVGTLGCIATMTADDTKRVILSNQHVLFTGGVLVGQKVGQEDYSKSCCCDCNKIAVNTDQNATFDCAIAELDADIEVTNSIKEIGQIKGIVTDLSMKAAGASGIHVLKRGRTTGLTGGTLEAFNASTGRVTISVVAGEGRQIGYFDSSENEVLLGAARAQNFAGLTKKYGQGSEKFAYAGDSGSVIVIDDDTDTDHHKVLALLNTIDGTTNTQGRGFDINSVIGALNITIHSTADLPPNGALSGPEPAAATLRQRVDTFEQELNQTELGQRLVKLYYKHRKEVFHLVDKDRRGKVLWQRIQGPKFVGCLQRAIKVDTYRIPREIEGITREVFLQRMFDLLKDKGSNPLVLDLMATKPIAELLLLNGDTKAEMLDAITNWRKKLVANKSRPPYESV